MKKLFLVLFTILILGILINASIDLMVFSSENSVIKVKPVFIEQVEVELSYIHSVAKTPVSEYFIVEENDIILKKTVFESYGAGLPLDGGEFKRENGKFVREGQNYSFEQLLFRVSRTKGQEIIINNEVFILQDLLNPGEKLILKSFTPFNYLRFRLGL
ncbi:MAG: DUF1850 domain-containing protein [Bacillota bacterium]